MIEILVQITAAMGITDFMNSAWGWPIVESLHFIGLSMLIGSVGVFDLRLLGVASSIDLAQLHRLVPLGVDGYLLNVMTGFMFFTSAPDQYLYNPAFQLKLLFMVAAGLNMISFYQTTGRAIHMETIPPHIRAANRNFAAVSLLCWAGVIICGRLITYYRPPYHWCPWC